jgi:hypothetical protein
MKDDVVLSRFIFVSKHDTGRNEEAEWAGHAAGRNGKCLESFGPKQRGATADA